MRIWARDATLLTGVRAADEVALVGRDAEGQEVIVRVPVRHRAVCTGVSEAAARAAARSVDAPARQLRITRVGHDARLGPAESDGVEIRVSRFFDLQKLRQAVPSASLFGAPATREEACAHFLRDRGGSLFSTWSVRKWEPVQADRIGNGCVREVRARAPDVLPEHAAPLPGSLKACCLDIETAFGREANDPDEVLCVSLHFFDALGDSPAERVQLLLEDERCVPPSLGENWDAANGDLHVCGSERDLLKLLMAILVRRGVDLVMGWNSNGFDVPHLATRARKAGVNPFPLSRRLDDDFHLQSKRVMMRGAYQVLTEVRGGAFGVLYWDPLSYLRTRDRLKTAPDLKLGTVATIVLGDRSALAAKDPVPYSQIYTYWTGSKRSALVRYCDKDTAMCAAIVRKMRLLDGVLAEARMLSLSVHALGATGQNARALACLDLTGRQQDPPALLPARTRAAESTRDRYTLHLGWRTSEGREERLSALPTGENCRDHYRKAARGFERTRVLEFDGEAERDAARSYWTARGYHAYTDKDVDKVPGGFVRQQVRPPLMPGEAPRPCGAALPTVMVMDFSSLYPSVIRASGIDRSTVLSWGEAKALGYSEDEVSFCPQRHVVDRITGSATPSPLPAPGKRWPSGLDGIGEGRALRDCLAESDYALVFDSPEELQLVERITDDTTVILRQVSGMVPKAIVLQLSQRKSWKQEKARCLAAGDAAGAAAADANQLACKESANSMYGVSLCEGGPLYASRVGRLIPQMGREAAMRLSEVLYTRDWAAHFGGRPAAPSAANADLWSGACAALSAAFAAGARFSVVYGDTDSVFVRPPCALSVAAAGALNLHLCSFFTTDVFGDGVIELEAENVYLRYLGVGQKRYAAMAFTCDAQPEAGNPDESPLHLDVSVRAGPAPPVHFATSRSGAPRLLWFGDAGFSLGADGPPVPDWDPPAFGGRMPARRLVEALCVLGLGRALLQPPKLQIKGLECVKRSCLGALRRAQLQLVRAAVFDAATPQEALRDLQAHLRWLASGAAPPTEFFANTRISKHPGEGFRDFLRGKRAHTEAYGAQTKALVAYRERLQSQDAYELPDDDVLGERATQDRILYIVRDTWTPGAKITEYAYPIECTVDSGAKPSRTYTIYHSLFESCQKLTAAIWPGVAAADCRPIFFVPAGLLDIRQKMLRWRASPFLQRTVTPAKALSDAAPRDSDERVFLERLRAQVGAAGGTMPVAQWTECIARAGPADRWECTPARWRFADGACCVCGERACSCSCDPAAALAETRAKLRDVRARCAECRSVAGYVDIEDAVRACDNRDCLTLYDRKHFQDRMDLLISET